MAAAADLYRLEQLDAELGRRAAERTGTTLRQGRNPELESAQQRLEDLRSREREASAEQRILESELTELQDKIKRDGARMYGGQIVDSRELTSLEKELEHHRGQRSELEERLLLVMETVETLQEDVAAATRTLDEVQERWTQEKPELERQVEAIDESIARLQEERDTLAGSIDPASLTLYQRIRATSGHAVSSVSGGICQWCRVTIPPKDVQHARAGALVHCSNCSRILYVA